MNDVQGGIMVTSNGDVTQVLTNLGLTSSQAIVYFTLTQSAVCTAKTISKASQIAREHIYKVLQQLHDLGLVEKVIANPSEFKALPIQEGLSFLLQRRTTENRKLNKQTLELIINFKNNKLELASGKEDSQFILIPPQKAAINKTRKEIEAAQTSIDVITSFKRLESTARTYHEAIEKALERGVKIRVITQKPENKNEVSKLVQDLMQHPSLKLRYILKSPSAIVTIYDRKEIFMIISPKTGLIESSGLLSNNPSLLAVMNDFYEILWITAIEDFQEFPVLKDPQMQV